MGQIKLNVIAVRATATTLFNLLIHASRNKVARRKIFQFRGVALHKALTVLVAQNRAFTTAALSQQHARVMYARWMELPELHVFQRNACTCSHTEAVAGIDEGVGRRCKNSACAARGKQHAFGVKDRHFSGFHLKCRDADHVAVGIANDVERHPFNEECGVALRVLLIERVQHCMPCAVSRRARTRHRFFTVLRAVATERALINRAVRIAVKRHTHVLKFVHDFWRFTAHEFDGVLIAEPVGAFHRIVEVVVPVVLFHVAERGTDAALRRNRVRARGEHFGEHRNAQTRPRQLQGTAHAGATGTDYDCVIFVYCESH